ncbi:unnamed protein product [Mycena citricolor]|uniref:Uncharacterized protein n=1 Tax=Mycena citricolor TaxID=2018698 RepID=A0AAD2HGQ5_9AGAR|nr:unnamed protein product [Mycena citricolor]
MVGTKQRYKQLKKTLTSSMDEMRANVLKCLDEVPLEQICRFSIRSARYIHAYTEGLTGSQAAWANHRYHGHRTLPPDMMAEAKKAIPSP